ncbi:extracellular solute-binding protein [Pseudodesulfovibrio tunisiensis]|uniref:extracellular solute-binding protein n=1 Tax=Pseudodesulfovibrio tunisiensis TaxID=463192 RepID=UPI001FB3A311|nr:extracellular solute-binding protein [Pseudodesulfovibrio tunisiensis]
MKLRTFLTALAATTLFLAMAVTAHAETTLNALFMSQAAYSEADVKAMTADFEAANPGLKVNLEFVPYEALHDKIIAAKGAGDRGYDVVLFDVVWPAEFAKRGFLVDVTDRISKEVEQQVFDGAWTTVSCNGQRYGMPWILDTKYMFYNKDMLRKAGFSNPPKTWKELAEQATAIKAKGIVEYPIVWSWSQSEAMICDYTTLVAAYGGKFFENGKPAFNKGGALDAVTYMAASLKDGLTNPSSREYLEEDVRRVFSNGEAAFAMNWTYMYNLANDPKESRVAGNVDVMPCPGVDGISTASGVNGSMGLGITSNSVHQDEAWKFITFLTSQPVQNRYARLSLPIWKSSYSDPEVVKGQEALVKAASQGIAVMTPRPLVPSYTELSNILQRYIHEALLGEATPADAMDKAAKRAARLR